MLKLPKLKFNSTEPNSTAEKKILSDFFISFLAPKKKIFFMFL